MRRSAAEHIYPCDPAEAVEHNRSESKEIELRKLIFFAHTTIDGFMESADRGLDWITWDDEVDRDFIPDLVATADTILTGRTTYQSFAGAWPQRVNDPELPSYMRDFARWMTETPMVVFTNTLDHFEMANARRAAQDIVTEIAARKSTSGGDLVIFGGAGTVQAVVAAGLVDEYWIKLSPTAIGAGQPVFDQISEKIDLELTSGKIYDSGVAGLRYATKLATE